MRGGARRGEDTDDMLIISMGLCGGKKKWVKLGKSCSPSHQISWSFCALRPHPLAGDPMAHGQYNVHWNALLGSSSTPKMILEDVYRFGEDYLCDIADTLESEVLRICEEKLKRARTRVVRKDAVGGGSGAGAGAGGVKAGGGGPTDSALNAEVAAGVDAVWETMVQAYELVGDQFEAYAMRNVFAWPEGLEVTVSACFHLNPGLGWS